MVKIYLAGGMRTNWQDKVFDALDPKLVWIFDPRTKGQISDKKMSLEEYSTWDLHHIKQCDIVFGFMERTNPSGIGMAVELGYAFGIGKTVILVLEENNEHQLDRYIQFMKKTAHVTFNNLEEGVNFLKTFEEK
jgi:nucleoside 2-deoxyribosyltransferase